jgi:hypothetical protein
MGIKRLFIRTLYKIIDKDSYRFIAKPFAIGLPSAVLACYKIDSLRQNIPNSVFLWIDDHVIPIVLCYFLVPFVVGVEDWIKKQAPSYSDNLSSDAQSLLLKAINFPVEKKMNRFLSELNSKEQYTTASQIFQKITKPEQQLAEITRSIHIFFTAFSSFYTKDEIDFTTVLFKMRDNLPIESWCCFPEGNEPIPELLKDPTTLAAYTANLKKMVIIEDIAKEKTLSKSKISKHCPTEEGSALCYPLRVGTTIPLVLRVTANKSFFKMENRVAYEKILEHFKKRILIEYALSELKNHVSKKST